MADEILFDMLHHEIVSQIHHHRDRDVGNDDEVYGVKKKDVICITKLESMGFAVGQSVIERFTREHPRFKDELDTMMFVCKDFWLAVFKKQVDNLRTNHQGVYVLQDNKFHLLTRISASKQYLEAAPRYLAFSCGLLRGALANLGITAVATAEVSVMPAVKFQVSIQRH